MRLSLFTPTHNPRYLLKLYNSILKQDQTIPYEWIIVPNNGVSIDDIPMEIRSNSSVKIIPSDLHGIGALKRFACERSSGSVFVEMDHDDILPAYTFQELSKAILCNPNGFYYSDFINALPNGRSEVYSSRFGWEKYPYTIDNRRYIACRAFKASARALCHIYFAPNHIRAWSREAYEASGGHDSKIIIGDDHDLICRTYLAKVPFIHIPRPLYIYRRTPDQSYIKMNTDLKRQHEANFHKYLHDLIITECQINSLPIIDLCDIVRYAQAENTVGCICADNVLQTVPREQVVSVINEVYRVLHPGGWFISNTSAESDWSENAFEYFCRSGLADELIDYKGRFQKVKVSTCENTVQAYLCALKGQRQPGLCEI